MISATTRNVNVIFVVAVVVPASRPRIKLCDSRRFRGQENWRRPANSATCRC